MIMYEVRHQTSTRSEAELKTKVSNFVAIFDQFLVNFWPLWFLFLPFVV